MDKLMKTSKTVDTILKVLYCLLIAAGVMMVAGIGFCMVARLLDNLPSAEITGISISDVELQLREAQQVEMASVVTEMATIMISGLIVIITTCYLIRILRKVLAPMVVGQPFDGTVSSNIKKLGIAVIVGGIILEIVKAVSTDFMIAMYNVPELALSDNVSYVAVNHEINLFPVLVGALVIMLSHVFRYGEELQKQADETL